MKRRETLDKLIEELGELLQIVAKKKRYMNKRIHDGRIIDEHMEKEMGDVIAAIMVVKTVLHLDYRKINKRINEKLDKHLPPTRKPKTDEIKIVAELK